MQYKFILHGLTHEDRWFPIDSLINNDIYSRKELDEYSNKLIRDIGRHVREQVPFIFNETVLDHGAFKGYKVTYTDIE